MSAFGAPLHARGGWWLVPGESVGDSPNLYNPKYAMAILSAQVAGLSRNSEALSAWPLPRIDFATGEEVRRSMSLNGMRMSMEYFQTGSPRVLQLVESRLEAAQRDVVHDVLVYLMQQVLDIRARAEEARDLRAESLAAYLGLDQSRVRRLLSPQRLSATSIADALHNNFAGPVRRALDVPTLVEGQLKNLGSQLRGFKREEQSVVRLMDKIVNRLFRDSQDFR